MQASHLPRRAASLAAFCWLASAVAIGQTPPKYKAEFLGTAVNAAGMNGLGQVVGTTSSAPGNLRGWVASSGSPLAELPLPPGRISSYANDITGQGLIAGPGSATRRALAGAAAT